MKRVLSWLLSVLVLACCCAMTVSADNIYNDATLNWTEMPGRFVVGDVTAHAGDTVVVPVCVENNPGIVSLKLAVYYDTAMLELVSHEVGDFDTVENVSFGPIENHPFIINWIDALTTENVTENGVVVYLTFAVKADAEGTTQISVSYDPNDVFDMSLNNVKFECIPGTVTIENITYGDINSDGKINIRDLGLLQNYLNKWDVTANLKAADVNADGNVNMRDLAILQRYLNNWDVELGPNVTPPPAEPELDMPGAGYDMDGKGRIVVKSSEHNTAEGKAIFVFENVSKQNGREWIIPEYSRVTYACYDAQGTQLSTGNITVGALEVDETVTCTITLPEGAVRIAFIDHNLEYWTPWA